MKTGIIFGASKGLGNAFFQGLYEQGDRFFLVSRSKPDNIELFDNQQVSWVQADLSKVAAAQKIAEQVGTQALDFFLYNAGIWESDDYERVQEQELIDIVQVNLTSLLLCCRRLLPNIRRGALKKVILIGSTCGLENEGSDSLAYTATKFATRGFAHALREYGREDGLAVTCISPGSIASDIGLKAGKTAALQAHDGARLPVGDLIDLVQTLLYLSPAACVKEIHIPAIPDEDV